MRTYLIYGVRFEATSPEDAVVAYAKLRDGDDYFDCSSSEEVEVLGPDGAVQMFILRRTVTIHYAVSLPHAA